MKNMILGLSFAGLLAGGLIANQIPRQANAGVLVCPSPSPSPQPTICLIVRSPLPTPSMSPTPEATPTVHELRISDVMEISKSVDHDCDGLSDFDDNCPAVYNPDQKDRNKNGIGDACEAKRKPKSQVKRSHVNR